MKRGSALLLLTAVPHWAWAAFSCTANSATFVGTSVTVNISISAGDLVFVTHDTGGNSCTVGTPLSIADSSSNSYTLLDTSGNSFDCITDWYAYNAVAATSVTVTASTSLFNALSVLRCSGVATTTPLDGHAAVFSSSGTTLTTASIGASGDLFIGGAGNYYNPTWTAGTAGGAAMTIPAGATATSGSNGNGSVTIEYSTGVSAGTVSISPGTTMYGDLAAAAFKPAGGGGGGPTKTCTMSLLGAGPC